MALPVHLWRLVPGRLPTVDRHDRTGHKCGLLRAEPQHDVSDLGCGPDPSHRGGQTGQPLSLGPGGLEMVREDRAGRDDVDPDAGVRVIK